VTRRRPHPQIVWRRIRAKVLAHRGRFDEAVTLVREAHTLVERIDDLRWQAATLLDVGEVLRLAGRRSEALAAIETALRLYEYKGDEASAAKARRLLPGLSA
jgi:tetratricopeptide (TPR) repeat protein